MRDRMVNRIILPVSGVIAIMGGCLMILGGLASHSLVLWILPLLQQEIVAHVPAPTSSAANLAVEIIALLISLGGLTVIFGGVLLVAMRRSSGRVLIALGGGAGFIGLLLALGYYVWVNGLAGVDAHIGY
jgi:hypothetical protein